MRVSCVLVLIAATFLATSEALADSDQIDQRSLRVHPPVSADSEERGFADIPLQRLNSLSEKIGVDVPKAASSTKYFNSLSAAARERYHDGLNVLLNAHRKKKVPQLTNE
ncbi:hypothetical protein PC128_g24755 [Phytophthora cactorum]|nr:hypothetical protein PC128_g24755 [Phytophthora cactorum]